MHLALLNLRTYEGLFPAYWLALIALQRDFERTLIWLGGIAAAVSVLAILQWLAGPSHHLFLQADLRDEQGVFRVRPPGQVLPYMATVFAACYLLWGPRRRRLEVLTVGQSACSRARRR
jgi:hypothetical protein